MELSGHRVLVAPELVRRAEELGARLRGRGWRVATAESLTGGAIAAALTAVAGSSEYVAGGLITYQSAQKTAQLGVPAELIERCGVVSEEVAVAMVTGAAVRFGVECALAVTGVAGPAAPGDVCAVGTVWVASAVCSDVRAVCYSFGEVGRDGVRFATVKAALEQLSGQIDRLDA
ncbi:MAG: CinA family protein [Coriobacteriia bacterium]|nr:CinA family protein [Coriobacteriia bacterium]